MPRSRLLNRGGIRHLKWGKVLNKYGMYMQSKILHYLPSGMKCSGFKLQRTSTASDVVNSLVLSQCSAKIFAQNSEWNKLCNGSGWSCMVALGFSNSIYKIIYINKFKNAVNMLLFLIKNLKYW